MVEMARIPTLRPYVQTLDTRTAIQELKKADPFYQSPEWRKLLARVIAKRGRKCEDQACETPRGPWRIIMGDHIIERRDDGAELDEANILLRCQPCHNRKTAAARADRHRDRRL